MRNMFVYLLLLCSSGILPTRLLGETANYTWIQDYIVVVPDFPKKGILFQSFSPLLRDPEAFRRVIQTFANRYRGYELDTIAGLDSRGFIFGAALAYELKIPFVMIRKVGKLPGKVERIDYELEYGTSSFEIEKDSIEPNSRVLVIDDVLATGGTANAACMLVEKLGGEVAEVACLIELSALNGQARIQRPVFSLIAIDD